VRAPDYFTPIVGWRAWRFTSSGTLTSVHHPTRWEPGVPVQADHSPPLFPASLDDAAADSRLRRAAAREPYAEQRAHEAPGASCTCGVYALIDKEQLELQFLWPSLPSVYGRVNLWGRVIVAEKGYRAQFAYPAEFWVDDVTIAEALEVYGVPVYLELREEV
jgi:hypothetical protein